MQILIFIKQLVNNILSSKTTYHLPYKSRQEGVYSMPKSLTTYASSRIQGARFVRVRVRACVRESATLTRVV